MTTCFNRSDTRQLELKQIIENAAKNSLDSQLWLNTTMESVARGLYERLTSRTDFDLLILVLMRNCTSFRLCGGAFVDLARGKDVTEVNDLDIFYVPRDGKDESFVKDLADLGHDLHVCRDVNERSKGAVHDIKVGKPHVLDLVSRVEVNECEWVDSPSCKSGLFWSNLTGLRGQLYFPELLVQGVLVAKPSMTELRVTKLERKGWRVVKF